VKNNVPHLLTYISGHGFGHVAQTAPVLNRLRQMLPSLKLTICSAAPLSILQTRIEGDFDHISEAADFGMVMASALDVLPEESLMAYQEFHRTWTQRIEHEAEKIAALKPDFVFSNVAYLPLAAAKLAGVPCAAMCSLNWRDIFAHYCGLMEAATDILQQMQEAYAASETFLRVTPGMPMESLPQLKPIAPIAKLGANRRSEIDQRLGLKSGEKLVLISLGGIATRIPMDRWPTIAGIRWLVEASRNVQRSDTCTIESLTMDFPDILASCDAFICKPGYGSFAEAACNGVPVLYVRRQDWPEEPCLTAWLAKHGRCVEISREALESGMLAASLNALWTQPHPPAPQPTGITEAADYLLRSISIASP
jgi:UDP:flavonoid glycosyltransferase YjiC (YdhE family)